MFDFDPRDYESRDEDTRDRNDEWSEPGYRRDQGDTRDHRSDDHAHDPRDDGGRERQGDDGARELGRGPGSKQRDNHSDGDPRDRDDERWADRDHDARDREVEPRDVFMQGLDLPRERDREIVHDTRGREYTLRGSETRTLSTVGAFRVVPARDLRDHFDRPADPRDGDLRHLREQGLIDTVRLDGWRDVAVVLTDRGRDLLESNRARDHDPRQEFYAGLKRERELEHDAQVYDAYLNVSGWRASPDATRFVFARASRRSSGCLSGIIRPNCGSFTHRNSSLSPT